MPSLPRARSSIAEQLEHLNQPCGHSWYLRDYIKELARSLPLDLAQDVMDLAIHLDELEADARAIAARIDEHEEYEKD